MPYRELKSLIEMLMALGYPRLISLDNFRNPNFPLMAEIMRWLAERYDENAEIPKDIDTATDRVFFIKTIAQFMATKAHIRLNTKKLYQADSSAVKEMLKAVTALYQALQNTSANLDQQDSQNDQQLISFDVSAKLSELKEIRRLATDITTKGAQIFDLLHKEPELREKRLEVLNHPPEISELERHLVTGTKSIQAEINKVHQMLESVAADENNLESKIEQRRAELDRSQKRMATLQQVRPAYMDEFERLEEELSVLYSEYVLKFRNLTFLEHQLDQLRMNEEAAEQVVKRNAERLREERRLRGTGDDELDQLVDDEDGDLIPPGKMRNQQGRANAIGNMGIEDDESLGDDNEIGIGGSEDDDDETEEEDDEDEDELIAAAAFGGDVNSAAVKAAMNQRLTINNNDLDDF